MIIFLTCFRTKRKMEKMVVFILINRCNTRSTNVYTPSPIFLPRVRFSACVLPSQPDAHIHEAPWSPDSAPSGRSPTAGRSRLDTTAHVNLRVERSRFQANMVAPHDESTCLLACKTVDGASDSRSSARKRVIQNDTRVQL